MDEYDERTKHIRHGLAVFGRVVGTVLAVLACFALFVLLADRIASPTGEPMPTAPPDTGKTTTQPTASPGAQSTGGQSQSWIAGETPSTVYAVSWITLYACARTDCDRLESLPPGSTWELSFTLKPDGWLYTSIDSGLIGYIRAADLTTTLPALCSLTLPYRVDHIADRFAELGYDRARITAMALDAERQIEEATGHDVLTYAEDAQSTVNLVISYYRDAEPYHRGLHVVESGFPNHVVGQFWIGIYAALIDDVDGWIADGNLQSGLRDTVIDNIIRRVVLHEMVHTTGFRHTDDPDTVMCGEPNCVPAARDWRKPMPLTARDVAALAAWCR